MPVHDPDATRVHAARTALFKGLYDHCLPRRRPPRVRLLGGPIPRDADGTTRRFAQLEIE